MLGRERGDMRTIPEQHVVLLGLDGLYQLAGQGRGSERGLEKTLLAVLGKLWVAQDAHTPP